MKRVLFVLVLLCSPQIHAQGLFDSAVSGDSLDAGVSVESAYELYGFLRGVFYAGKVPDEDKAEMKSGYSEASLKLRVRKGELGDGFAEIRFRWGQEFGEDVDEVDIREAYASLYAGPFDFRIGKQIVVWGRADGFNPTDNITPKNPLVRSPDEDDRREGNFVVRSYFNYSPLRLEAVWVPLYEASVIPTSIITLPPEVTFIEPDYPDAEFGNHGIAVKLTIELASLDGSVSYFNGFNPSPGINIAAVKPLPMGVELDVRPKAYRMHIAGADFSATVMNNVGLRGEIAYREPVNGWEKNLHIPNPDLQYIIGIDKEIVTDFSFIIQYMGRYVFDYRDLADPVTPFDWARYQFEFKNRLITFQRDELSHAVSFRPEWKLKYETLSLQMLGMYNFTTEELVLRPQAAYDIADALTVTAGGEIYSGPDDTLYGSLDAYLSAMFVELKASF